LPARFRIQLRSVPAADAARWKESSPAPVFSPAKRSGKAAPASRRRFAANWLEQRRWLHGTRTRSFSSLFRIKYFSARGDENAEMLADTNRRPGNGLHESSQRRKASARDNVLVMFGLRIRP